MAPTLVHGPHERPEVPITASTYPALDGARYPIPDDGPPPAAFDLSVSGVVERGHGVASGRGDTAPHPEGSLARQYPIFKERGLDLGRCFAGTLNVSIRPLTYRLGSPSWRFTDVGWSPVQPAENFLFARCWVLHASHSIAGWVYQPDPATKTIHFDNPSHLQVVAPFVPSLDYGSAVSLRLRSTEVELIEAL